jgi:hypothetical protein
MLRNHFGRGGRYPPRNTVRSILVQPFTFVPAGIRPLFARAIEIVFSGHLAPGCQVGTEESQVGGSKTLNARARPFRQLLACAVFFH